MSNSYFQFKQFRIEQGQTAMKVTTEACLLGSWVAGQELKPGRILDIGAGTGLLTLMLAQRYDCSIDAVEIDVAAALQARQNFDASPWKTRLHLIEKNISRFAVETDQRYDLIISNPPFFADHLLSTNGSRNKALHQAQLSQQELLEALDKLLTEDGRVAILYPTYESDQFVKLANQWGLFPSKRLRIRDTALKPELRQINLFSRSVSDAMVEEELIIKNSDGDYTLGFNELLREYYLYL